MNDQKVGLLAHRLSPGLVTAAFMACVLALGCQVIEPAPTPPFDPATDQPGIAPGPGPGGGQDSSGDDPQKPDSGDNSSQNPKKSPESGDKSSDSSKKEPSESPEASEVKPFILEFAKAFHPGYDPLNTFACETGDDFCLKLYEKADVPMVAKCAKSTLKATLLAEEPAQAAYLDCMIDAVEGSQSCIEAANDQCESDEDKDLCHDAMAECTASFRSHMAFCALSEPNGVEFFNAHLLCIYILTQDTGG